MAHSQDPIEQQEIDRFLKILDDERVQKKIGEIFAKHAVINIDLEELCNQLQIVTDWGPVSREENERGIAAKIVSTIKPKEVPSTSIKTENGG